jgi:lipopolysaccharide export system permease protein
MPPVTLFRYIALRTLIGVGALLLILASLILLIDLIENLRFAGKIDGGNFGLALSLTLMRLPALSQTLIPFVFLFGSIWVFNQLNRRSEISVMRSAGLSVWRLLGPSALIAALTGLLIITIFDPLSSGLLSYAEQLKSDKEGSERSLVRVFNDGIWLRQRDSSTQIIINAQNFDAERAALEKVTVWRFGPGSVFLERIDADKAYLSGRTIELHEARLKSISDQVGRRSPIYAIQTALTPDDLRERVAPPETMSLWQLPRFILLAEAAGLPTARYHIRFHDLCATPLKLLAMVLIAAAFSMRPVRMGGALELMVLSIGAGFLLYILSELSTALGESGLAPAALAAWAPALIATLAAVTALLHLEDG